MFWDVVYPVNMAQHDLILNIEEISIILSNILSIATTSRSGVYTWIIPISYQIFILYALVNVL